MDMWGSAEWLSRLECVSGQRALATSKINLRASFALQYPEKKKRVSIRETSVINMEWSREIHRQNDACEYVLARTTAFVQIPKN
jgi:hypothetical protein